MLAAQAGHGGHPGREGLEGPGGDPVHDGPAPHPGHVHDESPLWVVPESIGLLVLAAALVVYLAGVRRLGDRGPWPGFRTALWIAGLACVGAAWAGPLAGAARSDFTAHMAGHLLLGMLAPLLLVLAAPVTLALRALPPGRARTLSTVLRSTPARVLTHPVVAATLNAGGLWLLYTTDLYGWMHHSITWHVLVHLHVLLAGLAFTVAMVGPDPNPHRSGFRTRAVVLVLFIAAHSVLAKWLYGHPPVGVDPADARAGAQLMYYGGDVVDLALLVLLFAGWYPGSRVRSLLRPGNPGRERHDHRLDRTDQPLDSRHTQSRGTPWPGRRAGPT